MAYKQDRWNFANDNRAEDEFNQSLTSAIFTIGVIGVSFAAFVIAWAW